MPAGMTRLLLPALALACLSATPAAAYVGPGVGLTAIGTMVAVIAVLVLAVVGFVWYPLKRMMRKSSDGKTTEPRR